MVARYVISFSIILVRRNLGVGSVSPRKKQELAAWKASITDRGK